MYHIVYSKLAIEDIERLKETKLLEKVEKLITKIAENPTCPAVGKKNFGLYKGYKPKTYHVRLTLKHRIFYRIISDDIIEIDSVVEDDTESYDGIVEIKQAWGHDPRGGWL